MAPDFHSLFKRADFTPYQKNTEHGSKLLNILQTSPFQAQQNTMLSKQ